MAPRFGDPICRPAIIGQLVAHVALLSVAGCSGVVGDAVPELEPPPGIAQELIVGEGLQGRLVDLAGQPVVGATVAVVPLHPDQTAEAVISDADGRFHFARLPTAPVLLRCRAPGCYPDYAAIAVSAALDEVGTWTLVERAAGRCRLLMAGDTMFGRRFVDGDEDGLPGEAGDLIRPGHEAADATALFDQIRPVMDCADFRVVNFESPASLAEESRHPYKRYSFASHPDTLAALQALGIDAVSLGNNHSFDFLEPGRRDTEAAFAEAGIGWCGSGASETAARNNLLAARAGQVDLRLQGFNSIKPNSWWPDPEEPWESAYWYYALDEPRAKGGALLLNSANLDDFFQRTAGSGALRLPMLHGGHEYGECPSSYMRRMFVRSAEQGATLIKAHHAHTVYGMLLHGDEDDPCLIAACLGNFCFDQQVFETFQGYCALVTVDRLAGDDYRIAHARLLPFHAEDYVPRLVAGSWAARLARHVGHLSTYLPETGDGLRGAWVFPETGGIAVVPRPSELVEEDAHGTVALALDGGRSAIVAADDPGDRAGFLVQVDCDTPGTITLGRDLLIYGDFEDHDLDDRRGENAVWWQTDNVYPSPAAARSGAWGMALFRQVGTTTSVHTNLRNRVAIDPQDDLSLRFAVRGQGAGAWQLSLEWVRQGGREILRREVGVDDPGGDFAWRVYRLELQPPAEAGYLRLRLDMAAPADGAGGSLHSDDWSLIQWQRTVAPGGAIPAPHNWTHWFLQADDAAATQAVCALRWRRYRRGPAVQAVAQIDR